MTEPASTLISRRTWIALLCLVCGLVFAVQCWVYRFTTNPDAISYQDMADQLLNGDFRPLVHPYWSPLYPSLLALGLKVFSPAPPDEILVVHFVNGFIGLIAIASFTFFVNQWPQPESIANFRIRTAFAYSVFLWGTAEMIGFAHVSPDLCVAALVLLIAGFCLRLARSDGGWITAALLGIVLALGYYSKSAMLPLGIALLVILAIPWLPASPRRSSLLIAASIFIAAIAPHVFALSRAGHRITIGESGRLNYAWEVLREIPPHAGWMSGNDALGFPTHPLRVFRVRPTVLEFQDTVPGTYPLWYDPAFFHEGLRVHVDLRKQLATLRRSIGDLRRGQGIALVPLMAGFIVICILAYQRPFAVEFWLVWMILWALAAFSLFALVIMESRYVAPFVVLCWIALYGLFCPGAAAVSAYRRVVGAAAACVSLIVLLHLEPPLLQAVRDPAPNFLPAVVASGLTRAGLHPGDEVATVGDSFTAYYARLAHVRIVANIGFRGELADGWYDTDQFWTLKDNESKALQEELRRIGAKAIVSSEKCNVADRAVWHAISNTDYCVELLN